MGARQQVFALLFGGLKPFDTIFNLFILVLVLMNVAMLVASSVVSMIARYAPRTHLVLRSAVETFFFFLYQERIATANATFFFVAEAVSVGIFTIE